MLGELLHDEEVLFSVWLTLKVAAVCLALHLITAVPLALWARSPKAPFRRTLNLPDAAAGVVIASHLLPGLGEPGWGAAQRCSCPVIFAAVVLAATSGRLVIKLSSGARQ
ncbi:MAG: hypothetical protein ACLR0N_14630 [Bilophila wadsworthia]